MGKFRKPLVSVEILELLCLFPPDEAKEKLFFLMPENAGKNGKVVNQYEMKTYNRSLDWNKVKKKTQR